MLSQLHSRKKSLEIFPLRVRPERSSLAGCVLPSPRASAVTAMSRDRATGGDRSRAEAAVVNPPAASNSFACLDGSHVNKAGCRVWDVLLPASGDILPHGYLP